MKVSRVFIINWLLVIGMFGLSIWAWLQLPSDAQIATRFDFDGLPTAYMSKMWGLLLSPLIALAFVVAHPILPKIEPNKQNLNRSQKAYDIFSIAFLVFFSIVHSAIVFSALGQAIDVPTIVIVALGGFLIVFGNYFSKIRRNYSFGVRTPWTLSSNLAWHKTHRLAGWLTVIHGVGLIITALRSHTILPVIVLISFVVTDIVVLPVYSYLLWRSDSNRSTE